MTDDQLKHITLQQMEAFIYLVEERSFSRAAKRMFLTQPALTKTIHNMEDCLGMKVVNRSSTGVSLTPAGKILYGAAHRMLKLRREAADKIQELNANRGGNIYLGASTIPATYILPYAVSAFRKSHQDIRIFIKTEDSEEVLNMVLDREVEIGCIGKEPQSRKVKSEPLWNDRLILVVPRQHRWAQRDSIELNELLQEPFVLREKGSGTREVFENYLAEKKSVSLSQLNVCGEFGSSEAIKEAVIAGLGVSVLSVHAVKRELASKILLEIPLASCCMERRFYLVSLQQFECRPHHRAFIQFMNQFQAMP